MSDMTTDAEGTGGLDTNGNSTSDGAGRMDENGITLTSTNDTAFTEEMVKTKRSDIKGDGSDVVTVLIYMNGSDLESERGEATEDLYEMLDANISGQVNVLVETVGTKSWSKRFGIASDHSQRYKAEHGNLILGDDSLGQLDCTAPDTLSDFISWGTANYPADRYTGLVMMNTSRRVRC